MKQGLSLLFCKKIAKSGRSLHDIIFLRKERGEGQSFDARQEAGMPNRS